MQNKQYISKNSFKNKISKIYHNIKKYLSYHIDEKLNIIVGYNIENKFDATGKFLYNINIFKITKIIITSAFLFFFSFMIINANSFDQITIKKVSQNETMDIKESDDELTSLQNVVLTDIDRPGRFIYIVQRGDTIDSIAQDFGVTVKSIKTTNKISSDKVKSWQELTISEVDGMIYDMSEDTTLIAFAWKYGISVDDLKELNYISDANQKINKWDEIFIPIVREEAVKLWIIKETKDDKDFKEFIKQNDEIQKKKLANIKPTKPTKPNTKPINKPTVVKSTKKVWSVWKLSNKWRQSFGFALGNCTRYAAQMRPDIFIPGKTRPFWGNGRARYANARSAWFRVNSRPSLWAIVVFTKWRWWYGHVGIVRWYDSDSLTVESMNYRGRFIVSVDEVWYSGIAWYIPYQ